jgi:hypothetical protein
MRGAPRAGGVILTSSHAGTMVALLPTAVRLENRGSFAVVSGGLAATRT